MALIRCQKSLEAIKAEGDLQIGINNVKRALEEPIRQIASNADQEPPSCRSFFLPPDPLS